jgi:ankyrin repeat protein
MVKDGTVLRAVPLSSDNSFESGWVFPIHWAAAEANPVAIRIFLEAGVDPNMLTSAGESPIHWLVGNWIKDSPSSEESARECLSLLVATGADINKGQTRENPGYTALHFAAWFLSYHDVGMLCEYGARIDSQDVAGNSPLHVAASVGTGSAERFQWEATIKAIVNNGADVGLRNNAGERAIDVVRRVKRGYELGSDIESLLTPQ